MSMHTVQQTVERVYREQVGPRPGDAHPLSGRYHPGRGRAPGSVRVGIGGLAGAWCPERSSCLDYHHRSTEGDRPAAPRSESRRQHASLQALAVLEQQDEDEGAEVTSTIQDDRLRLIFTCCHPALALEAHVALTLRTLGGLTTAGDRAGVPGARSRPWPSGWCGPSARSAMPASPMRCRADHELPERLAAVLPVLYLIFNEGYSATSRAMTLIRPELCAEAIRLTRVLFGLMPDEPEVLGLLALMLLHDARLSGPLLGGRRADPAGAAGPNTLGPGADPGGHWPRRAGAATAARRAVPGPGGYRGTARRGPPRRRYRLAADRGPLHHADEHSAIAGRRVEPGSGGRDGVWSRGRPRASRRDWR